MIAILTLMWWSIYTLYNTGDIDRRGVEQKYLLQLFNILRLYSGGGLQWWESTRMVTAVRRGEYFITLTWSCCTSSHVPRDVRTRDGDTCHTANLGPLLRYGKEVLICPFIFGLLAGAWLRRLASLTQAHAHPCHLPLQLDRCLDRVTYRRERGETWDKSERGVLIV